MSFIFYLDFTYSLAYCVEKDPSVDLGSVTKRSAID